MSLLRGWMMPVLFCWAGLILGMQRSDPAGDQLEIATSPAFDLLSYSTSFEPGAMVVTLTFDPASVTDLSQLSGYVDFDTDQNPNTGRVSHSEEFGIDPFPSIGVDYYIEFYPLINKARLYRYAPSGDVDLGLYTVDISGATATITLPRCHTTPCSGIAVSAKFDSVVLAGNLDGPTDVVPNDSSVIRAVPGAGDMDADGDVDSADYALFSPCVTGAKSGPVPSPCSQADLDHDNDVDQADFGMMQRAFTGPL
jgi:hypothetical protein